jgi:hypothetical protein
MSHSAPSDSSTIDATFIVGTDLVEFARLDLPIYLTSDSRAGARWAEACVEEMAYGAPLDRLFGEADAVFVDGIAGTHDAHAVPSVAEDSLVMLNELSEGLILPATDEPATMRELAAIYDFGAGNHTVVHLQAGWSWDQAGAEWSFDHHA